MEYKHAIESTSEYFNPKQTLECGQLFRFSKNDENDYTVFALDKRCRLCSQNCKTVIECDDREFFENYFDLNTDYREITRKLTAFPELKESVNAGRGIRILRQDLFETLISFIISANNNIPRIKGIIERLCINFGRDMGGYHAFPTPEELYPVTVEKYRELGAGFRDSYLFSTVRAVCQTDILKRIKESDTEQAGKLLLSLKGVGRKVADCIILFGLARTDSYPVDTWIFKAGKTGELNDPKKVRDYYLKRYGALAGYAQQYVYYAALTGKV